MTERTIEHMARELAGQFYDLVRSAEDSGEKVQIERRGHVLLRIDPHAFRKSFPTVKDYLTGRRFGRTERLPDGTVRFVEGPARMVAPAWLHFYDQARQILTTMLGDPATHPNIKAAIYDALMEDRTKQLKQEAAGIKGPKIPQRKSLLLH